MKNKIKFNLQLFAQDFATALADSMGVSVEPQEVAEPDVANNIDSGKPDESAQPEVDGQKEDAEASAEADEKPPRDLEKDSAFAKLRREKEALEKAQKERDKWYAENFGDYGITTESEYRQKVQEQRQAELLEKAQEGDTTAIDELSDMKAQEKAEQALQAEKLKMQLQSEVNDLNREFNLNLTSYEDIQSIDNGSAVVALMSAKKPDGDYYSAVEAYKMVNYDKIMANEVKKAKQQTKNEMNGFNHTKVDTKGGSEVDSVTLDNDTLAMFERMGMKPDMEFLKKMMK